jgi:hypothetical protein
MIRQQIRAPKVGDRVAASGQQGTFEIVEVTTSPAMARLRSVRNPNFTIVVPWGALKFLGHDQAAKER